MRHLPHERDESLLVTRRALAQDLALLLLDLRLAVRDQPVDRRAAQVALLVRLLGLGFGLGLGSGSGSGLGVEFR